MFLHSGASLHGHEYSNRPAGSGAPHVMPPRRSPLLRSAFAAPKTRMQPTTLARPSASPQQHSRSTSEQLPRTPEHVVRFKEPDSEQETQSVSATSGDPVSESEMSDAGSHSTTSRRKRRRRRSPKKTTNYILGYPTPKKLANSKVMQKVLPRLLLQLQIYENGWLKPVLEVFPASRIAGPAIATRLAKKFSSKLSARRQLARDDLVLIQRDDRSVLSHPSDSDDEKVNIGDDKLLAVYSPLKNSESAEIALEDGSVWVATPLPSGSVDFVHVDSQGKTTSARWAKRNMPVPSAGSLPTPPSDRSSPPDSQPQSRFTFSIINPLSRRHPVMATLTESALEIQDTYTSVSASYGRYPPSRTMARTMSLSSTTPGLEETDGELSSPGLETERTTHVIDEATKTLISVTALWVALRSGWSPCYSPPGPSDSNSPVSRKSSLRSNWGGRSDELSQRVSTPESADSSPTILKRFSAPVQQAPRGRSLSPDSHSRPPSAKPLTPFQRILPRRATSTGAAFMQRRLQQSGGTVQPQTPTQGQTQSHAQSQSDKEGGASSGEESPEKGAGSVQPRGRLNIRPHSMYSKSPDVLASMHLDMAARDILVADDDEAARSLRADERQRGIKGRLYRWINKLR